MRAHSIDQLIRLPEEAAIQRHFDAGNYRAYRWILYAFAPIALVAMLVAFSQGRVWPGVVWALNLVAIGSLFLARRSRFFERNFREILILYLASQFIASTVGAPDPEFRFALAGFLLPLCLLLFRLRTQEYLGLLAIFLAGAGWVILGNGLGESLDSRIALGITVVAVSAVTLAIGRKITTRSGSAFRTTWRREVSRESEQSRMRDELNDARKVQLSMLPRVAPQVDWLDLSSATLPASEVGGDYFDYVTIDEDRLAIVIGDVAGHGMASGLLLAAVRGGLHLLRGELDNPETVLQRLDMMVRDVAPSRMYMTLQIAVLDRRRGRVTVVSAGHPPALLYSAATQTIQAIGTGSIPLGTQLASRLESATHALAAGDVLVFYTDGVPELLDLRGEAFGDERLEASLAKVARNHTPRQIRDAVLDTITHFKSDAEMLDDLTLLVARIRG